MTSVIPAVDYLRLGDEPHLVAHRCDQCGALYFDRRNACARCSATTFSASRLSNEGVIRAYTVVQRGAKSGPFTSVVVDLVGGGVVKANLVGPTGSGDLHPGTKVRLVTFKAGVDDDGTVAMAFGYEPMGAAAP
ncbi:Zn-ribbon domain-containing OB-fold protein [Mycobacterium sp. E1747]|uniref:Zn-ribbon domain-containing OB-fold protein n=1 Tax=Mycobacterium sp. E1747 TaxID=1834128 RepID=UPI0008002E97|nr:OB-fold domain-containing protein [Mycobacterium sp. E1747]OBH08860.1 hypothetical protein A5695_25510 [Mycobacterium sp. E1747]